LSQQINAVLSDIKPDAIKTGMLLTRQTVEAVAAVLRRYRTRNLVIDPVLRSSSGRALLQPAALALFKKVLLPQALIVTPNIPEAEVLAGISIKNEADMDFAAGRMLDLGPLYVLIKGGHGNGPATDTLYGGKTALSFSTVRRKGAYHGTGCVLSAAITVFIARGLTVEKAVEKSKRFVDKMLKNARPVGKGRTKYFQF
jgi:hydroxymethylpyrimidine/phosphomethylpyrimidine kinase